MTIRGSWTMAMACVEKAWTLVAMFAAIVLVVLVSWLCSNVRKQSELDAKTTNMAIAAGLCQVANLGSMGYHWDKCVYHAEGVGR